MRHDVPAAIRSVSRSAPYLDQATERDYLERIRQGDEVALAALVASHLRIVLSVARAHATSVVSQEDLVSEGIVGLCEAARRFDLTKSNRFSTYARWWVRAQIRHHVLHNRRLVGPPNTRSQRRVMGRWTSRVRDLTAGLGRAPTDEELARAHGVEVSDVEAVRTAFGVRDRSIDDDERLQLSSSGPSPEVEAARRESASVARAGLRAALEALDPREAEIIEQRYLANRETTLQGIGSWLGISGERVRQLEQQAMQKMRLVLEPLVGADALADAL